MATTASIPVSRITERSVSSRPPATESGVTHAKEDPPHSKTSIARVSYHLKDLPKLFVVEVEINAIVDEFEASNSLETIWNRKLREEALNELLDNPKYDDIRKFIAFDTRGSGNTNYIIFSLHDIDESTIKSLFVPDPQQLKKTTRRVKTENGYEDQRVLCEILEGRTCTDKRLPKLYWPNLSVMVRKRATGAVPKSKYGIDHDFFEKLQDSDMDKIDVSVMQMGIVWDLTLRNTPTIDARRKLLHFNYDLDVVIPANKRVHSLLSDVLGSKTINGKAAEHMSIIERLLIGLQVRCAYLPPDRTAMIKSEKGQVFLDKLDQRCRQFRITDVRTPSAIPNLAVDGMPSEFSVQSFFNNRKYAHEPSAEEKLTGHSSRTAEGKDTGKADQLGRMPSSRQRWLRSLGPHRYDLR
jgi:hypothetical protein